MSTSKRVATIACIIAVLTVAIAVFEANDAREVRAALRLREKEHAELQRRVDAAES